MKKVIGTILAIAGFIGFFCEADNGAGQVLVTGAAISIFIAGVYLLGGFKEQEKQTTL